VQSLLILIQQLIAFNFLIISIFQKSLRNNVLSFPKYNKELKRIDETHTKHQTIRA